MNRPISYSFYKALFCPIKFYVLYYCNRNLKTKNMYIGTQLHSEYEFLLKKSIFEQVRSLIGECSTCTYNNDSIIPKLKNETVLKRSIPNTKTGIFFTMKLYDSSKCAILVIDKEEDTYEQSNHE